MPRQRKDYRLPPQPAHLSDVGRPESLVIHFTTPASKPAQVLDLSAFAHRPRLGAELALAFRYYLADKSYASRVNIRHQITWWLKFLDEHDPNREAIQSASDVGTELLRAYIAWLGRQPLAVGSQYHLWSVLKRALAWLRRHRPDLVQPGLDLPIRAFPNRNKRAHPRAALARPELDAVLRACRVEIEASWADFETGRALPAAKRHVASAAPGELDLKDLGTMLALVVEQYGSFAPLKHRPDPNDLMHSRVWYALRQHGGLMRISRFLHATADTLVPYMIAIAAQTFANPEALRNLRRDCMIEHVMLEGRWLVTWHKGRASRVQRRSFLRDRGLSVPNLIDRVLALTAPLLPDVPASERDRLFLCAGVTGEHRVGLIHREQLRRVMRAFVARHGLRDLNGTPLALPLASFRPTGLALAHRALGYDVAKTQVLGNHASVDTTMRYVHRPIVRADQAAGLARLQGRFVEAVREAGEVTGTCAEPRPDAALQIDARNATASGFTCADPLAGIAPGQRRGRLCTAWLGCFACPNAVIPLEADTLARLLRMRDALAEARSRLAPDRWGLLYAPKLEILERDVLPHFPAVLHAAASQLAGRVLPPPPIE